MSSEKTSIESTPRPESAIGNMVRKAIALAGEAVYEDPATTRVAIQTVVKAARAQHASLENVVRELRAVWGDENHPVDVHASYPDAG